MRRVHHLGAAPVFAIVVGIADQDGGKIIETAAKDSIVQVVADESAAHGVVAEDAAVPRPS